MYCVWTDRDGVGHWYGKRMGAVFTRQLSLVMCFVFGLMGFVLDIDTVSRDVDKFFKTLLQNGD
jgi:hypothetical protein